MPILNSKRSPILVFGLAGRIGSGASFVRDKLLQSLKTYDYEVELIQVTKIVDAFSPRLSELELSEIDEQVKQDLSIGGNEKAMRVRRLQLLGNALRTQYGNDILAVLASSEYIAPDLEKTDLATCRKAFIIDSLKNCEEVDFLRRFFGRAFWMVGVVAPDVVRLNRLTRNKNFSADAFKAISDFDAKDGNDHGQEAVSTVLRSDYFLVNDSATKVSIEDEAGRFTRLVFGVEIVSPTPAEVGMHIACQSAFRSACLSRQVGAAIFADNGQLLATGHNDVPKFRGGLYIGEERDEQGDHRCWAWGRKCYNDEEKGKIISEIVDLMIREKFLDASDRTDAVGAVGKSGRIKNLIEFTRAVHAEMEAIISIARDARPGLVSAVMYTTTYPCHNCAKHIIDAGIKRVVYLEPYEKSLARELHPDAINDPQQEEMSNRVSFVLYGGVAPHRYEELFQMRADRKTKKGEFDDHDRERAGLLPRQSEEIDLLAQQLQGLAGKVDKHMRGAHGQSRPDEELPKELVK